MNSDLMPCLAQQYGRLLPFVAYRKPGETSVMALMQGDRRLHSDVYYQEQGFIMAPYARDISNILIPGIPKRFFWEMNPRKNSFEKTILPDHNAQLDYEAKVLRAIAETNAGRLKKVVLSRKHKIQVTSDPLQLFERLLHQYPAAFTYIWYHPTIGLWLGATPETLVSMNGLRFNTMALAGTKQFRGSEQVTWGSKEREEQQLVVDTIKSQVESLNVSGLLVKKRETLRAGNLLHLKTEISGILPDANGLGALIDVLHPTPAVCGLPRDIATTFIKKNEGYNREFYTGFLGELNLPPVRRVGEKGRNVENRAYDQFIKKSHLFVNLRCMQYLDQAVDVYVGGGITLRSEPFQEWMETENKMQTMLRVLGS